MPVEYFHLIRKILSRNTEIFLEYFICIPVADHPTRGRTDSISSRIICAEKQPSPLGAYEEIFAEAHRGWHSRIEVSTCSIRYINSINIK